MLAEGQQQQVFIGLPLIGQTCEEDSGATQLWASAGLSKLPSSATVRSQSVVSRLCIFVFL